MLLVLRLPLVRRGLARIVERGLAQRAEVPLLAEPVDALLLRHLIPSLVAERAVLVRHGKVHREVAELRQWVRKRALELGLAAVLVLVLVAVP